MSRILVCGGRDFDDYDFLKQSLDTVRVVYNYGLSPTIISGCARGADTLAIKYAQFNNLPIQKFPADWDKYGKAAGHIRNKQMLDEGKPDVVIAFPGGRGTQNMIKQALDINVKVIEFVN